MAYPNLDSNPSTFTSTQYYQTLNLDPPSSSTTISDNEVKTAYRAALLKAHPDKHIPVTSTKSDKKEEVRVKEKGHTIDDVKQAYTILATQTLRAEYDAWLKLHVSSPNGYGKDKDDDFILGLEVLDLGDFEEVEVGSGGGKDGEDTKMEWVRPCRCGEDKGFRIEERELEDVMDRGGKEVVVGCVGCSLWVRVGFDVEEG